MSKYIQIEIDMDNGVIKTEAFGYKGVGCKTDLSKIEAILNANHINRKPKPELKQTTHLEQIRRK